MPRHIAAPQHFPGILSKRGPSISGARGRERQVGAWPPLAPFCHSGATGNGKGLHGTRSSTSDNDRNLRSAVVRTATPAASPSRPTGGGQGTSPSSLERMAPALGGGSHRRRTVLSVTRRSAPLPLVRPGKPPLHTIDLIGRDADCEAEAVFGVGAGHHLGVLVEPMQAAAVGRVEGQFDQRAAARELVLDSPHQPVDPLAGQRRDGERRRVVVLLVEIERRSILCRRRSLMRVERNAVSAPPV